MQSILEQFLKEEANSHVRGIILAAAQVQDRNSVTAKVKSKFEFNRFEVTLNFLDDVVLIEDVLDPASSGELRLPLSEFLQYLRSDGSSNNF